MLGEVRPVVAAGIDVRFVGDVARGENFVECFGAGLESKVVLVAAIEINFHAGKIRVFASVSGLLFSQNAGSGGEPKTPPSTRERMLPPVLVQ